MATVGKSEPRRNTGDIGPRMAPGTFSIGDCFLRDDRTGGCNSDRVLLRLHDDSQEGRLSSARYEFCINSTPGFSIPCKKPFITNKRLQNIMANKRSFHGDLSLLSAVNLFQLIGMASLTGQLKVRCARKSISFIFTEGRLNYAFSRQGRKKIGQILLESQLITIEQLKTCLADQRSAKKWQKLGSIAVKNGYIQQSNITDIFFTELKVALFEVITWDEGRFSFVETPPLADDDIVLEENIESLVMQALFFIDSGELKKQLKQ